MKRRWSNSLGFLVTASCVAAFHALSYSPMNDDANPWLLPLLLVIPIGPVLLLIESVISLPPTVEAVVQSLLSAVFWGLVVVCYREWRRSHPPLFTGL